jgi:hypothetical protein
LPPPGTTSGRIFATARSTGSCRRGAIVSSSAGEFEEAGRSRGPVIAPKARKGLEPREIALEVRRQLEVQRPSPLL